MVLENRNLSGSFDVQGVTLHCQDYLRAHYMKDLKNAHVIGLGWDNANLGPGVKILHTTHRNFDKYKSIDYYQNHVFTVIIENTDAEGYVSEKIYSAFSAGSIPIYYGNNNAFTNIPHGLYVDLKKFKTSIELQQFIDGISVTAISTMREAIYDQRESILQKVSQHAYADTVVKVLGLRQSSAK
jgi:hypothetical protein